MSNNAPSSPIFTTPAKAAIFGIVIGAVVGVALLMLFQWGFQGEEHGGSHGSTAAQDSENTSQSKEPLYWVAPMDPNYRKDGPGKSPMGMDLVPVYEGQQGNAENNQGNGAGVVTISPNVVNNLGVKTAPVKREPIDSKISTVGYVQYDEDEIVHIHPRVAGWVEKLHVKAEGDRVEKGEPIYTLYSPQLVNAQEELVIALKRKNTGLINGAKDRLKALQLSEGLIQNLEKTLKVQQNITFYAPQSGVVDGLNIREGFYVKPENTLLSIAKLNKVWVEAEIFERDAALVKKGLPVSMTVDYLPGKEWKGNVDYIYPSLNESTRTLRVRLKFDNTNDELKPNMFASVTMFSDENSEVVVVPKAAVIRTGTQNRVVVALGDGQFKSVHVDIGRVGNEYIEIVNGVVEGDEVAVLAQFLLDSESSKTSDFARMNASELPKSVWMEGEINHVMAGHRMVNISHGPVKAWDWPEMTMDFMVADGVDFEALKAGQTLHFEVTKDDNENVILTGIHIMSEPEVSSATVNGVINDINIATRTLNISRGAIEKWGREPATMDFIAAEHIALSKFSVYDEVTFTFEIRDDFIIVEMNGQHGEHNQHRIHDASSASDASGVKKAHQAEKAPNTHDAHKAHKAHKEEGDSAESHDSVDHSQHKRGHSA